MKKLLLNILLIGAILATVHRISSIETNDNWIYLYDSNGYMYKTLSTSDVGKVIGYSATFFVSRNGHWIYMYNSEGKRYKTLSYSYVGDVLGVSEDSFTSRNGNWVYTWDSRGKRIHIRAAR